MSGHSKWNSIKHKKGAADAARGKVFTRHAKLITIAARDGGGDPDMNPGLRLSVENAKKENMPNENIDRAIKKGTGEDKEGTQFFEMSYEGYGPGGVAVLVECLTDNKNRTVASVRSAFSKNGGNLGESGSVAFLFEKKGIIVCTNPSESLEMAAIEAGAENFENADDSLEISTAPSDFFAVKSALEAAGAEISLAEIHQSPMTSVSVTDEKIATPIVRLLTVLEDDDDVSHVFSNADISSEMLEKVTE